MSPNGNEVLAVFARAPALGRVKTRLSPPLSAEQGLALHTALVEDTLEHLGRIRRDHLEKFLLLSQPLLDPQDLSVPESWTTAIQAPGDLGKRLAGLFYTSFRGEARRIVVVGSDSPTLPIEAITEAFEGLVHSKVVLGPAEDGGYYLLGCSEWIPEIFQHIDWGTETVLEQTTTILKRRDIPYTTLIPWYDIDRAEDLEKLRQEIAYLKRSDPGLVPLRVAAALPDLDGSEYSLDTDF